MYIVKRGFDINKVFQQAGTVVSKEVAMQYPEFVKEVEEPKQEVKVTVEKVQEIVEEPKKEIKKVNKKRK